MTKKVTCPNATFVAITTILETLKKRNKLTVNELINETSRSLSWVNNAIPLMAELGLVYRGYDEKIIGITNKGNKLIELIEKNDKQELKEYGEEIYKKSEILRITRKIILHNPDIKIAELGKKIADGLNIPEEERWKNEATYIVVARSCKSILGGLQLIEYQPMKYTRSNVNRFQNKLMPYASTVILDNLIKDFDNGINEIKKDDFNQYQRQRKTDYFNCAIMLGIVERVPGDKYLYKLTSDGKNLKEAKDFSEHAKIFQEILLKNPHVVEIIKTIKNNYDEINSEEIGSIVGEYNKSNWGKGTKTSYGHNFLNWLLEADIMVKRGRKHGYTFQPHFLDSINYKKYIEGKNDISITVKDKIKDIALKKETVEYQPVKLIYKITSLDDLDYTGLLEKLIIKISKILYDNPDKWNNRESDYTEIVEIYNRLLDDGNNDYKLISGALTAFEKGYKNRDKDLLIIAQKNNLSLLEKTKV